MSQRSTNLPRLTGALIGREHEVACMDALLGGGHRLVTVLGAPGVGKSRLALELAWSRLQCAQALTGGAWYCDLRGEVTARRAHAIESLAGRGHTLLLLDNVDGCAAELREPVARWLRDREDVRVLVTSRQRLGLPGEVLYELAPLSCTGRDGDPASSPAAELLVAHARTVCPGYAVTDRDALGAVVERLDGIPLALRAAGDRLSVLNEAQLEARLGPDSAWLWDFRRALDHSWTRLSPAEQAALAQCGVFHGSFTVDAAEQVLELPEPVLPVLERLRARSLLAAAVATAGGGRRLRLLRPIRAYARQRLAEGSGLDATADRHARHFCTLAARATSNRMRPAPEAVTAERAEVLAAVSRRLSQAPASSAGASLTLGAARALNPCALDTAQEVALAGMDAAVARVATSTPALAGEALLARACVLLARGEVEAARGDVDYATRLAAAADDTDLKAAATTLLGDLKAANGDLLEASRLHETALSLARRAANRRREAHALARMALTHIDLDRLEHAERILEHALTLLEDLGDTRARAEHTATLGLLEVRRGRISAAEPLLRLSLDLAESCHAPALQARSWAFIGSIHHRRGEMGKARAAYDQALELALGVNTPRLAGIALLGLSLLARERSDHVRAYRRSDAAIEHIRRSGDQILLARVLGLRATLESDMGRDSRARSTLSRARAVAGQVHAPVIDTYLDGVDRLCADAPGLVVEGAAERVQLPDGVVVDLRRRRTLRQVLMALVKRRLELPGYPLAVDDLWTAGWPSENIAEKSAANRVYVAISTLRGLGLREHILRRRDGYLLDPATPIACRPLRTPSTASIVPLHDAGRAPSRSASTI